MPRASWLPQEQKRGCAQRKVHPVTLGKEPFAEPGRRKVRRVNKKSLLNLDPILARIQRPVFLTCSEHAYSTETATVTGICVRFIFGEGLPLNEMNIVHRIFISIQSVVTLLRSLKVVAH